LLLFIASLERTRMKALLSLFIFSPLFCFSQLTIIVDEIPANTPELFSIHIAGDFQGWDPADPNYVLVETTEGNYETTINPEPGLLTFKFTRGSWDNPEGNENGGFLPDRTYLYSGTAETVTYQILSWEDTGGLNSTAQENVMIWDTDYNIPQLERDRRIWVYLPPDYETALDKYYPVLYMHDGQNVFDAATSFSGEWEVDETLNELFNQGDYGVIVVAIDNGGQYRLDEYSPWVNDDYGGGQGDDYVQFLINTLKPDIDSEFRTLPGRGFTGVMGSSMGGLISMYAGREYEEVFGKIGSFSPAYWFADESIPHAETSGHESFTKIYTVISQNEGAGAVIDVDQMDLALQSAGFTTDEMNTITHTDGAHSEWYWVREFGDAYEWLFSDVIVGTADVELEKVINVYPNVTSGEVKIDHQYAIRQVRVLDQSGKSILTFSSLAVLDLGSLDGGVYFLSITDINGDHFLKRIIKN